MRSTIDLRRNVDRFLSLRLPSNQRSSSQGKLYLTYAQSHKVPQLGEDRLSPEKKWSITTIPRHHRGRRVTWPLSQSWIPVNGAQFIRAT